MKPNQTTPTGGGRPPFLFRFQGFLFHSLWTPERDEKRFLAGLPMAVFLILVLWKQGMHPLGRYLVPVIFSVWCLAYVIRFRVRLTERGEFKRVIIAPAVFVLFLLCIALY